ARRVLSRRRAARMSKRMVLVMVLCAVGLALALACASAPGGYADAADGPATKPLAPGDHRVELEHGGRKRFYLVHVPPARSAAAPDAAAPPAAPLPVVLVFHGGGGNPAQLARQIRFDALADREGFV